MAHHCAMPNTIIKSPLLMLQEYNTDVWEMVMIYLVKARMKYVINDFEELYDICDSDTAEAFKQIQEDIEETQPDTIHPGRLIIRIIMGHSFKKINKQLPITYESKYFVYGFYLEPSKVYRNSFRMKLQTPHCVVNVLDVLSRLNNFEFDRDRTNQNATIYDIVRFLYEREEQIENDTHIYCMVKNEIEEYCEKGCLT